MVRTTILTVISFVLIDQLFQGVRNEIYDAKIEDYPHVVAIETFTGQVIFGTKVGSWKYNCAGSLINSLWVLSSSFCPSKNKYIRIVFGTSTLSTKWTSEANIKSVYRVVTDWKADTSIYLLRLSSELNNSTNVHPILMSQFKIEKDIEILQANIIGWQVLSESNKHLESFNLKLIQTTMTKGNEKHVFTFYNETENIIHADTGSGMIVSVKGTTYLYGVVLFNMKDRCENCFKLARVSTSHDLIEKTIFLDPFVPTGASIININEDKIVNELEENTNNE